MAVFTKTVTDLEAVSSREKAVAEGHAKSITALQEMQGKALAEAEKAQSIATKLQQLITV